MDGSDYLRKHGWRGLGYSLDHNDRGIKKPLLISKKVDVLGVGLNKHAAVSDQWWLRAFDQGLKSFGTGEQTALSQIQKQGVNRGGLYARFVKGAPIPSSIGQTIVPTSGDLGQGSSQKLPIDQPRSESNSSVVGSRDNDTSTGPPSPSSDSGADSPSKAPKMTTSKRKRATAAAEQEKRARRKLASGEAESLTPEQEALRRRVKAIDRRLGELLYEAHRRGVIAPGPKEIRKGVVPSQDNGQSTQATLEFRKIMELPGLQSKLEDTGKSGKAKDAKIRRERMKREFNRAAKAFLIEQDARAHGDNITHMMAQMERSSKKARKEKNVDGEEAGPPVDIAPSAGDECAKRDTLTPVHAGVLPELSQGPAPTQSKALERAKIDNYRAVKHGMTLASYRDALAHGTLQESKVGQRPISEEKLAEYTRRAAEKGVELEQYMKRREEKYAAKQAEKLGIHFNRGLQTAADDHMEITVSGAPSAVENVGFVVDTDGDLNLLTTNNTERTPVNSNKATKKRTATTKVEKGPLEGGTEFAREVLAAIAGNSQVAATDRETGEAFLWDPSMPIPKDPRIWEGVVVKTLPKPVREARRQWMQDRRDANKIRKAEEMGKPGYVKKRSKGERKIEARETFVRTLLAESRKAKASGNVHGGSIAIQGVAAVPLVKVDTRDGQQFSKAEMSLARTVATRVLKAERKKEKKEKRGASKKPAKG